MIERVKTSDEERIELTQENLAKLRTMVEEMSGGLAYSQNTAVDFADHIVPGDRQLWWVGTKETVGMSPDGSATAEEMRVVAITGDGPRSEANAKFFCNSRRIVLSLLDRIDALQTGLRTLERRATELEDASDDPTVSGAGEPYSPEILAARKLLEPTRERLKPDVPGSQLPFKPSDVVLEPGAPLTGTMGKAEAEHAALLLVLACKHLGDTWQALQPKQIGETIEKHDSEEPLLSLKRNPFFRPDFHAMVQRGFARFLGEEGSKGRPVELTEKGIEALRRWVRR